MKRLFSILILVLFLAALLTACGGGGGGNTAATPTYTVGGTVSGLSGSGLVLQDNGGDDLTITSNGTFTFATTVADGAGYNVTVKTQPAGPSQTCAVSSGTGTVSGANVTGVTVACLNCAPNGVNPTRTVSASLGNDATADGSCSKPYKTVTAALATMSTGTVWVAPGTYDAANGEVFPISVPAGVSLIGDVANKGDGTTATLIKGHGAVGATGWYAALVSGATSTIAGCEFADSVWTVSSFGIYGDNVSMAVTANTFLSNLYGGVVLQGSGNPSITNNTFQSSAYGVYAQCTGTATIQGNTFTENSIPINNAQGNTIIQGNTFTRFGNGQVGIQVEHGSPSIQNNTFSASSYIYAALRIDFTGSPIVRSNTFNVGTGPAVQTVVTAVPDLGTAISAGNNIFSSITGTVISHGSSATIYAIGNTWPSGPACGSQIVTSGTGTVVWGTGGSNHCP